MLEERAGAARSAWLPPGRLALAPMDGVTDWLYRELLTSRASGIAFCVSEFVRVSNRPAVESVIRRAYPECARGGLTRSGVPVMLQLLGGSPMALAETAKVGIGLGAFGIDLNFGCPAKLVNRHDGGASLLRAPARIERIVAEVRRVVPAERAVSVKVRLGWQAHDEVIEIARAAERGGASWLTIHGRTKLEMYGPPANWAAIGSARAAVGIPVVANGDLNSLPAIQRCGELSGCTHFMLGRGAMGRPSLFESAGSRTELERVRDLLLEYTEVMSSAGTPQERQVDRVKQWLSLGSRANPALRPLFEGLKRSQTRTQLSESLVRTVHELAPAFEAS